MTEKNTHRTVVIGAGFGGLRCVVELEKRFRRLKNSEVVLIDSRVGHVYTPLLYEVATGLTGDSAGGAPFADLKTGVLLPFDRYMRQTESDRVQFQQGTVTDIDLDRQRVELENGETVSFDHLVLAIGAKTATYGVPGVREHAHVLKSFADAVGIQEQLRMCVDELANGTRETIRVAVVGGGATGTEFAAELANTFQKNASIMEHENAVEITLVESNSSILRMFEPRVQKHAIDRLESLGITVRTETRVVAVEETGVVLQDGEQAKESHDADVVVWAAGITPYDLPKDVGLPTTEDGFVRVDKTLQVKDHPRVFAIGDCARFVHADTNEPVPALGQAAVKQAALVAENVTRRSERRSLIEWHPPARWNTVVPLGGKIAIADLGWITLRGWIGYVLRKMADLLYFLSILRIRDALYVWLKGAHAFIKND